MKARSAGSHFIAIVAGVSLAMAFALRATPSKTSTPSPPRAGQTSEFHRALQVVLVQMDAGMCITPSADVDRDFARAMIPHHQGAVAMARLELLFGRDPGLRRLAQGIVVEQSQEIALLQSVLAADSTPAVAARNP
jgi:uncharacterized protein (DUF305 family)